jgi:hypothetical protein
MTNASWDKTQHIPNIYIARVMILGNVKEVVVTREEAAFIT